MNKIEQKILQLEIQIREKQLHTEKELLLIEMKKIGIEKLPYSYSSLKPFIDSETMNVHYNKHYKGYVEKLNDALAKKNYGDLELEKIIKNISRYNKTIRNNAGGAFNHALFWNMLSPTPKKLKGELFKKICSEFGSFSIFTKKFEKVSKDRFGSGWAWLVLTKTNRLKIMSTPNQDNPLMNVIKRGGFPLLGLDLWEHAYYLKYKNKRDEYIKNFWKVVNWDFVTKLYEMRTKTNLVESLTGNHLLIEKKEESFVYKDTKDDYSKVMNYRPFKLFYSEGMEKILKKRFPDKWRNDIVDDIPGVYGLEGEENERSMINNLTTNYTAFHLLTMALNDLIKDPYEKITFYGPENKTFENIQKYLNTLDKYKDIIFNKHNPDFIRIFNSLKNSWERGKQTEELAIEKLQKYLGDKIQIEKKSGLGKKVDVKHGIDVEIIKGDRIYKGQIKPFSHTIDDGNKIRIIDTANVEKYNVDMLIFANTKNGKVLVFRNNPEIIDQQYVFDKDSLRLQLD
jgi:Fe-Mn family superoxide dismutase